jgi:hypothetical protein
MKQDNALKQWVEQWGATGKALDRVKRDELQHADAVHAIHGLDGAFRLANRETPIRLHSGLVEMQAFFKRMRQ